MSRDSWILGKDGTEHQDSWVLGKEGAQQPGLPSLWEKLEDRASVSEGEGGWGLSILSP